MTGKNSGKNRIEERVENGKERELANSRENENSDKASRALLYIQEKLRYSACVAYFVKIPRSFHTSHVTKWNSIERITTFIYLITKFGL